MNQTTPTGTEAGIDLDKLEALLSATTPGEWLLVDRTVYSLEHDGWRKGVEQFRNRFSCSISRDGSGAPEDELVANAEFIVAAKHAMPALIALARRAAPLAHPIGQGSADPILATWPERIWLNNGDTDERQDYGTAREVFGNAMTWSADQIDSLDVEYVRADLAPSSTDSAQAAMEQEIMERRIAIIPENEGGFHAHEYGDQDTPKAKGYGETPTAAIRALKSTAAQAATQGDKS
jgi:hypothetical protein